MRGSCDMIVSNDRTYNSRDLEKAFSYDNFGLEFSFQIKLIITFTFQIFRSYKEIYIFIRNYYKISLRHWGSSTHLIYC